MFVILKTYLIFVIFGIGYTDTKRPGNLLLGVTMYPLDYC